MLLKIEERSQAEVGFKQKKEKNRSPGHYLQ